MTTAQQKIREKLSDVNGIIQFQHEGSDVIRWLTGGSAPSVYATFKQLSDDEIVACCPHCSQELGSFDAHYGPATYNQLGAIREAGSKHLCPVRDL